MTSSEGFDVSMYETERLPAPKTARHRYRQAEDGLERLFREDEKARTAKFHYTDEDGLCHVGNELLRVKEGYAKFLLKVGQYPFFVGTDGPMQGFTGIVNKPSGLERKVLISPIKVPEYAYEAFRKQTENSGSILLPILTYRNEIEGILKTSLLLKDQRIKVLEDDLEATKQLYSNNLAPMVEQSGKSFAYQTFTDKDKRLLMDLSDPQTTMSVITFYISIVDNPVKFVVTNEGNGEEFAEIIFLKKDEILQAKYSDKVKTLYGEEAVDAFYLLPHKLKDQGRVEVYSMENTVLHLEPGKGLTRRLSVEGLAFESVRRLDESSDEWKILPPDSE